MPAIVGRVPSSRFEPEPGLVIRYDFLWQHETEPRREHGLKDRPCAVVLVVAGARDRPRRVVVCPITHSPPDDPQTAVAIPPRVAGHLGLDQRRSWIRTHQVNVFEWKEGLIPFGVSPARPGRWSFGQLPYALGKAVFDQVLALSRKKRLVRITRT